MACSLNSDLCFCGIHGNSIFPQSKQISRVCSSFCSLRLRESKLRASPEVGIGFTAKPLIYSDQKGRIRHPNDKAFKNLAVHAQASYCVSRSMRWWEKTLKSNMVEIDSAQELVDLLLDAGDRLVILDFYSPGCGGCKALHPKICQLAEMNPDAIFLKVNYENLKTMCHAIHIHVLPFFRFYRGSEGRLCSFSCTNATIKKFKDALAKHGTDRCSIGPTKGLDASEIRSLASVGEISSYSRLEIPKENIMMDLIMNNLDLSDAWSIPGKKIEPEKESSVLQI